MLRIQRWRWLGLLAILTCFLPSISQAATLAEQLAGRIVLQVQDHGEAWYIDPVSYQRFYLGRAADAYAIMRKKGLGIRHAELHRYLASRFPARLSGRIVLDVESHGEAYYISPLTLRGAYLGTATDAYALMRSVGLGITNARLAEIPIAPEEAGNLSPNSGSTTPAASVTNTSISTLERAAFNQVNAYRASKNLAPLAWKDTIAQVARIHSQNMASGRVAFGHEGFTERAQTLARQAPIHGAAENVAYNDYPDPATTAVNGWIGSEGHRLNMENPSYTQSGLGVAVSSDGAYYFTQLFTAP